MLERTYARRNAIRTYPPLFITCHVYAGESETPLNERTFDYNEPEARNWFARHCVWAWLQGYEVQTFPASAIDIANMAR